VGDGWDRDFVEEAFKVSLINILMFEKSVEDCLSGRDDSFLWEKSMEVLHPLLKKEGEKLGVHVEQKSSFELWYS
jgi:hypothetical protein